MCTLVAQVKFTPVPESAESEGRFMDPVTKVSEDHEGTARRHGNGIRPPTHPPAGCSPWDMASVCARGRGRRLLQGAFMLCLRARTRAC